MKFLITGATGFVGLKLVEKLFLDGHKEINVLTRSVQRAKDSIPFPVNYFKWNPEKQEIDNKALDGVDVVINLAGESVAGGRWSKSRKESIYNSRINASKLLMESIAKLTSKPKKIINASAIGIYGNQKSEILNEENKLADDFLAKVCKDWEASINSEENHDVKSVVVRTGVVLGRDGGALKQMLLPFKLGAGGRLADGKQYMSWIHVDDLVSLYIFLATIHEQKNKHFVVNATALNPVTNSEFTKTLGTVLKWPTIFPVPGFVLKLIFGEMSQILLDSQRVVPKNIIEAGFKFKYTHLRSALDEILMYEKEDAALLNSYQWLPDKNIDEVFGFFKDENNLEKITPQFLGFKVLGKDTDIIKKGTLIDYKISLRGIPMKWRSKIDEFVENEYFTDTQITGPYKVWEHQHLFKKYEGGILMQDKVKYKLPFGFLGKLFGEPLVKSDLAKIFSYRKKVIHKLLV